MMSDQGAPPTVGTVVVSQKPPLQRWGHVATLILEALAAAIIVLMMLLVTASAFRRYVFGAPIQGTIELVGFVALPAVVFIGYVVAQSRGQAIDADIVYSKLPRQIRREVRCLTSAVSAAVCVGFGWYGLLEAIHASKINATAPASTIYIAPIYWFVPAAFAVLVVLFVLDAWRSIRGRFDQEHAPYGAADELSAS